MRGKTKMDSEEICKEVNRKIIECPHTRPRYILLDIVSYINFQKYMEKTLNIPPVEPMNLDSVKLIYQGLELLMIFKNHKFIEVM